MFFDNDMLENPLLNFAGCDNLPHRAVSALPVLLVRPIELRPNKNFGASSLAVILQRVQ